MIHPFAHIDYANAFEEFGTPEFLPNSGGWHLKRGIPGYDDLDLLGGFPYLMCENWEALAEELPHVASDCVSIAAIPDPLGDHNQDLLKRAFPDLCIHYKDHCIVNYEIDRGNFLSRKRRKRAEKAIGKLNIEFVDQPVQYVDTWMRLFEHAKSKFDITGIRAYSRQSFQRQFSVPGVVMSLARYESEYVAAHVQFADDEKAYAYLAAASPAAYELDAHSALYFAEIEYYRGRVSRLDWGGDVGASTGSARLSSFKRGWSNDLLPVYLCGRILNPDRYRELERATETMESNYFPSYRAGELVSAEVAS